MNDMGVVHLFRLVHLLAGVFWVGATIFISAFLFPSLRASGPAAGTIMEQIVQVRRLPVFMMTATILTILSGLGLYWRDSGGFTGAWMGSGPGIVFGFGGLVATAAAVLGMAFISPNARRMSALGAQLRAGGGPPAPEVVAEIQALQGRVGRRSALAALLLVVATAAMAVARYVP